MGRGANETATAPSAGLLYGQERRNSARRRRTIALASAGVPSGIFVHPNFKPGQRRLGTSHYYEAREHQPLGHFSGTNQWAAKCQRIPEPWRRSHSKTMPDDVYLHRLLGMTSFEGPNPWITVPAEQEPEPVIPVVIGAAYKPERTISWYSELGFPDRPELDGCRINADYAMAVYKLAGEHGYWQLEYRDDRSIANMALTLRDEESKAILGIVSLSSGNK